MTLSKLSGVLAILALASSVCAADPPSTSVPPAKAEASGGAPTIDRRRVGDTFPLAAATVKELDITRVVENDFSKRFSFDTYENPSCGS